jgi:hypothetical protein
VVFLLIVDVIPGEIVISFVPVLIPVITVPAEIPDIVLTTVPTYRFATDVRVIKDVGKVALAFKSVVMVQVDTLGEEAYADAAVADELAPATTELAAEVIDNVPDDARPSVNASAGSSPVGDKEIPPTRTAMEIARLLINISLSPFRRDYFRTRYVY